jgi:glycerophosphoryl diester phosphodiesterase
MQLLDPKKRILYLLIGIIILITNCSLPEKSIFLNNGVTAHRGNSAAYPENTIPAFKSALSIGVDWIELDIYKTNDDKIVVIHDANTNRVGNKNLAVSEVTYEELKSVDVAHDFRARNKLNLTDCPPEVTPLLSDIIQLVMQQNSTRLSIQPKSNCVEEAMKIINKLKAEKWIGFNDGNLQKMKQVKKYANRIPVFWDRPANSNIDDDLKIALKEGFQSIVINQNGITKDKVDKIHKAGLEAGAWTVNDPEIMKSLLGIGVDRFYTDRPEKLIMILKKQ